MDVMRAQPGLVVEDVPGLNHREIALDCACADQTNFGGGKGT